MSPERLMFPGVLEAQRPVPRKPRRRGEGPVKRLVKGANKSRSQGKLFGAQVRHRTRNRGDMQELRGRERGALNALGRVQGVT